MGMNHALPVITFDYFNFLTQKSPPSPPHTHTKNKKTKKRDRKNSLKVSIIEAPKLAILKNIITTTKP